MVYCQALRIIERCSRPDLAEPHLEKLREKLVERNYPVKLIESKIDRAKLKDRKEMIFQKRKNKNKNYKKVRLIFTHNQGNPPLHAWIRESKNLLSTPKAKKLGENIQVVYKQSKNIKRMTAGGNKGAGPRGGNSPPAADAGRENGGNAMCIRKDFK